MSCVRTCPMRAAELCHRFAEQVARLDREDEEQALTWIEAVTEFDDDAAR